MKNWTTRHLVTLAVFGALWGVAEMSLGAVLHALKLPLTGLIMSGVGMLVALTGYSFVPRRGAVLTIGVVAALLKAFSVGSVVFSPMLAIVAEAILAELALALGGGPPRRAPLRWMPRWAKTIPTATARLSKMRKRKRPTRNSKGRRSFSCCKIWFRNSRSGNPRSSATGSDWTAARSGPSRMSELVLA